MVEAAADAGVLVIAWLYPVDNTAQCWGAPVFAQKWSFICSLLTSCGACFMNLLVASVVITIAAVNC